MNKYKTFEELKEELGDKFEDYMYKANIELLNKLYKIKEKQLNTRRLYLKDLQDLYDYILELLEEVNE